MVDQMTAPNIHSRTEQQKMKFGKLSGLWFFYRLYKAHKAFFLSVHIAFELVLLTPVLRSSFVLISHDCGLVDPIHAPVLMDAADRIDYITEWPQQRIHA